MNNIANNSNNRIGKYQNSIDNFLKSKFQINHIKQEETEIIIREIKKNHYLLAIFLLTLSNNIKKNKIHQHGYYIGSSIELILLIARFQEKENLFKLNNKELLKIVSLINIFHANHLEQSTQLLSKDKSLKSYNTSIKQINTKIINLLNSNTYEVDNLMDFIKSDIFNYKFDNSKIDKYKNLIRNSKKIKQEDLIKYVETKYCNIIELGCLLTWVSAGGAENNNLNIQKMGKYFGFLLKLYFDILELEHDIENNNNKYFTNIVVNLGIQNTFEYFITYKKKLTEVAIKLGLFNNIIREIIEYIENKLDIFIENTILDMREEYEF